MSLRYLFFKVFTLLILLSFSTQLFSKIKPVNLRCEYLSEPQGIDMSDPRFYWQLKLEENGQYQKAYQLIVSTDIGKLNKNIGDTYNSGKVLSNQNTHLVYQGEQLKPATHYYWKVKVWDKNGKPSGWSETAKFSTGLFREKDWKNAQWIAWRSQEKWEKEWWRKKKIEKKCTEVYLPSYFGARMNMWERYHFHHEKPYDPAPLFRKEIKINRKIKDKNTEFHFEPKKAIELTSGQYQVKFRKF